MPHKTFKLKGILKKKRTKKTPIITTKQRSRRKSKKTQPQTHSMGKSMNKNKLLPKRRRSRKKNIGISFGTVEILRFDKTEPPTFVSKNRKNTFRKIR